MLDSVHWLTEHEAAQQALLPVDPAGALRPGTLADAIDASPGTVALVTVMWANNEVGTVQPIAELAAIAREHGIPFHTDAVQAAGQLPVSFAASGADAMTVTAHKFGGPVGAGALLLARGVQPVPVLHGGGQESEVRSGTLDAPAIRAFAVAAAVMAERRADEAARLAALRDDLIAQVLAAVPDAILNGPPAGPGRLPGNAHFSFPGCEGDALLMLLDAKGIACSTGSACTAGVAQPSHVLLAMGADEARARGSLRFSLGHTTTQEDVDALGAVHRRGRGAGPPRPLTAGGTTRPAIHPRAAGRSSGHLGGWSERAEARGRRRSARPGRRYGCRGSARCAGCGPAASPARPGPGSPPLVSTSRTASSRASQSGAGRPPLK